MKVILEDLPDKFAQAIQDYNRQVTEVFSQYLKTVAAELEKDLGEEKKLPLSGIGKNNTLLATYISVLWKIWNVVPWILPWVTCIYRGETINAAHDGKVRCNTVFSSVPIGCIFYVIVYILIIENFIIG